MKFNKDTYTNIFELADEIWLANGGTPPAVVAATSAVTGANPSEPSASTQVVSAAQRGNGGRGRPFRGRGRGRGGGSGRGGQNNTSNSNSSSNSNSQASSSGQKPHQRGPRHADGPPDSACSRHWSQGRSATYCSDPLVCEWSTIIKPRPKN